MPSKSTGVEPVKGDADVEAKGSARNKDAGQGPSLEELRAEEARLANEIARHRELIRLTERREEIRKNIEEVENT